jgi:hypothetical protein
MFLEYLVNYFSISSGLCGTKICIGVLYGATAFYDCLKLNYFPYYVGIYHKQVVKCRSASAEAPKI